MLNGVAETLRSAVETIGAQLMHVLIYPLNPSQRIFHVYVVGSFAFAIGAYLLSPNFKEDDRQGRRFLSGLFAFVFPKKVWGHASAWVDVRYFIPHQLLRLWIYTDFLLIMIALSRDTSLSLLRAVGGTAALSTFSVGPVYLVIPFVLITALLTDFVAFYLHYWRHRLPLLWAFHKVHHSAEVLHPLSNYREHPVDNFAYAIATGAATGLTIAMFVFCFGVQPVDIVVPVLGVNVFVFSFNVLGYNLRHSHIWVRWPGALAYVFGCPAHHQIHHSCKPEHLDKNFAFMFPIWDVMFGTFYLPEREETLDIGLADGTEAAYRSYAAIYLLPFLNLLRRAPIRPSGQTRPTP